MIFLYFCGAKYRGICGVNVGWNERGLAALFDCGPLYCAER
jgi:hypothetical protein